MLSVLTLLAGLGLLVAGGELLVRGASRLADALGVSPLVVGLTVVAFGTSAPELAVSLQAVRAGTADLALGNVIGSNIFNVLFILGVSALVAPLVVSRRIVWVEVPIMIAVSVLTGLLALDGRLGLADGAVLVALVIVYTTWLIRASRVEQRAVGAAAPQAPRARPWWPLASALAGLALLVLGARAIVAGAVAIAAALGVSDVIVGLTVVAAGTSLPEVAASITATVRGQRDIAIGNVIGSNIFNLTVILGATTLSSGQLIVPLGVLGFDMLVMLAVAVACLPIVFTGHRIARWEGGLFVAYYAAYAIYLALDATEHALLPQFADAMRLFVLPLTALTLMVLAARTLWHRSSV